MCVFSLTVIGLTATILGIINALLWDQVRDSSESMSPPTPSLAFSLPLPNSVWSLTEFCNSSPYIFESVYLSLSLSLSSLNGANIVFEDVFWATALMLGLRGREAV